MSVEIEKINKPGGFQAEWDNICRLYRMQLVQKKLIPNKLLVLVLGGIAVISLFGQLSLLWTPEDVDYIRGIGGMDWLYMLILMFCIDVSDYNILSAENMSMYPGTVRTRFISRLMIDYTMIFVVMVCGMICRLLGVGVTRLFILLTGNAGMVAFFDFKSLLLRSVVCLCYMLMLHSIYILLFVIATKIGNINTRIAIVTIGVIVCLLFKFTSFAQLVKRVVKIYIGTDLGIAATLMRTLLTAAVLMVISFVIMSTIHTWRESNSKELLAISIVLTYVLMLVISFGAMMFPRTAHYEGYPEKNLEAKIQADELLTCDYRIQAGVVDGDVLEESCMRDQDDFTTIAGMDANITWMNLEKAVKKGMVPEGTTLADGEMFVRVVASSHKYQGQYLYRHFIDGVKFDIIGGECVLNIEKNVVFYDAFLSVVDRILGGDVMSMELGDAYSTIGNCQIYVIYNKGDIKRPGKLSCQYGMYSK